MQIKILKQCTVRIIVRFTLNSSTRIIEFHGFLSQFSTNFHEILHAHQPSLVVFSFGSWVLYRPRPAVLGRYNTHDPLENTTRSGWYVGWYNFSHGIISKYLSCLNILDYALVWSTSELVIQGFRRIGSFIYSFIHITCTDTDQWNGLMLRPFISSRRHRRWDEGSHGFHLRFFLASSFAYNFVRK